MDFFPEEMRRNRWIVRRNMVSHRAVRSTRAEKQPHCAWQSKPPDYFGTLDEIKHN
jgi:hypothetical protein